MNAPNEISPPEGRMRGNYVMLRADTLRLLIPQDDVGPAEHLSQPPRPGETPYILQLPGDDRGRLFLAISERMTPLAECPPGRFLATTLGHEDEGLHWCWSEVQVMIDAEIDMRPLPESILAPYTPVRHYVEQAGGGLAFVCSARQLAEFVLSRGM